MAADVVFTQESPWYTNSHTWERIREYALSQTIEDSPGGCHDCLDALGVDFTFMSDGKAVEVARWLSGVIGRMLSEGDVGSSETDRQHMQTLIEKLHSEILVRETRK